MMATDVLISIHGAQLSNILFMRPSSGVIEVFNPQFFLPTYQNIAFDSRLQYVAVKNTTIVESDPTAWHPYVNAKVSVNITNMVDIVEEMVKRLQ